MVGFPSSLASADIASPLGGQQAANSAIIGAAFWSAARIAAVDLLGCCQPAKKNIQSGDPGRTPNLHFLHSVHYAVSSMQHGSPDSTRYAN
jgi:hypothetical protein